MKFYIDGKWITCDEMPLIINLSDQDKKNIAKMKPEATVYGQWNCDKNDFAEMDKLGNEAKEKLDE